MDYSYSSGAETPSTTSPASATSPSHTTDDPSSDYLKVPGEDLYIRPASRTPTPRLLDHHSISPDSSSGARSTFLSSTLGAVHTSTDWSQNINIQASLSRQSPTIQPTFFYQPPRRSYLPLPATSNMANLTPQEIQQLVNSLQTHQVNTLVELRRIEKIFANLTGQSAANVTLPMTAAWSHYVNSHALLTELRATTKNYPFSTHCIEEAKRRVYADPQSNRSWNFCWLVLNKIQSDKLIPYYAGVQAADPAMWGQAIPTAEGVQRLTTAFMAEWNWAVSQLLRHWDRAPQR